MIAKWAWRIAMGIFIWMIYQAHIHKTPHVEASYEEELWCYGEECYGV